jgi:hypothetical protein
MMRETDEKAALTLDSIEQFGSPCQSAQRFLQEIAGICFAPGEIQKEGKERLRVGIVNADEFAGRRHAFHQRRAGTQRLSTFR